MLDNPHKSRTGDATTLTRQGIDISGLTPNRNPARKFLCQTKEYEAWRQMIRRCIWPKASGYEYYGGRGISVCGRWRASFENFFADVGRAPSLKHSIDRINNDGNYEPGNVRWATAIEQANNKRPRARKYGPKQRAKSRAVYGPRHRPGRQKLADIRLEDSMVGTGEIRRTA